MELQLGKTQLQDEFQDKQKFHMKEEPKALREVNGIKWKCFCSAPFLILCQITPVVFLPKVNKKLTSELETIKQRLEMLQCQLQELTAEKANSSEQITDLEAKSSQLIRDNKELRRKVNEGGNEMREMCCQLR